MRTKSEISVKFINLFEKFRNEIKTSKKLDRNSFYGFAKYYIKNNTICDENNTKGNPIKNLERKLKRWEERLNNNIFQEKTFEELLKYYKSLNENYCYQELLPDEYPQHWFD
ncbi:hypothetical protein Abu_0896 [Aliarcobacter butzleri RM4018]|uniref:Uncharacterized protein n=1 Tax=Aliarcobacter butzleri (strain RM4018) TaxID=367737 RepID=A8ET82_ALIB4|nr:hypothetical protein [Aliarcobacter butzleri]ABV67156.1 hypothetical protein Abu_0896 [Aliarcobacter butzleri RM4018]GGT81512.1 hypothetical protein GCM10007985_17800 [Aliarcobacter butzleri]SNV27021.1 Uncharacterised protein [Aliarcobacter butzleri]